MSEQSKMSGLTKEMKAGKDLTLLELFHLLQPKLKNEAKQPMFMLCVSEEYTAATIEGNTAEMMVQLSEILTDQPKLLELLDNAIALTKVANISEFLEPALKDRDEKINSKTT